MNKLYTLLILIGLSGVSALKAQETARVGLTNDIDSLSYGLGLLIGNNMHLQGVEKIQPDIYLKGVEDGFRSDPLSMSFEEANIFIQQYFEKQMARKAGQNLQEGQSFLDENAGKEGVVVLPSGLQYKVLQAGEGKSPGANDQVKVHYRGTLLDGSVFDSSYDRGEPAVFGVKQVIKGWTEALMLMKPGSKWMLYIPSDLAYGQNGAGDVIGPNATLIFEVELLEVLGGQ